MRAQRVHLHAAQQVQKNSEVCRDNNITTWLCKSDNGANGANEFMSSAMHNRNNAILWTTDLLSCPTAPQSRD
jgi:hypothetical protein